MPKEKRKVATGNSSRHAPLGQQIADDENRSKYAAVRSRPRASSIAGDENEETLLDEKTSQKILALSKEQMLEVELEEQRDLERKRAQRERRHRRRDYDSSDEEDEGDDGSVLMGIDDEEECVLSMFQSLVAIFRLPNDCILIHTLTVLFSMKMAT